MPARTLKPAKSSISRPSTTPSSSSSSSSSGSSSASSSDSEPTTTKPPKSSARPSKQSARRSPSSSLHSAHTTSAASVSSQQSAYSVSGPRPPLNGYPADFSTHIPGYCSHKFEVVRSETTAKLWTCESCASSPHWFIFECRFCEMKTCRPCTYHQ